MSSYILFAYFEIFYMCKHPQREREGEKERERRKRRNYYLFFENKHIKKVSNFEHLKGNNR